MIDTRDRHGNPSHANESGTTELTRGLIEDVMIPKGDTKIAKQARNNALTCGFLVARTRFELVISALRGRRPKPLDERAV